MSSVDVIVPCYRYGHYLRECVESVLTQSMLSVRVLIIDDASPDNTCEVVADLVREDPRVTSVRHTTNRGHIATYNEGIEWASADYMMILSADDYLLPGALARAASLMDAFPEIGFTFGKAIVLDDCDEAKQVSKDTETVGWRVVTGRDFIELGGANNIVHTPTAVVRTELQRRLGGYRQELPHSADMEMWLRFASRAPVGIVGACQAVYRRHSGNMSLEYMAHGWLPDLQQRKGAIDYFFQTCGNAMPDAKQLHRRLFWALGCTAVGFASAAFNRSEMKLCDDLSAFAVDVCPQVERSIPWMKLSCKRLLGSRAWSALRPTVARIRQARGL